MRCLREQSQLHVMREHARCSGNAAGTKAGQRQADLFQHPRPPAGFAPGCAAQASTQCSTARRATSPGQASPRCTGPLCGPVRANAARQPSEALLCVRPAAAVDRLRYRGKGNPRPPGTFSRSKSSGKRAVNSKNKITAFLRTLL